MTIHLGYVATGATIYIPFHTFNSSGASVTISGLAVTDIEIYKNGSVTQRSSDAGYTLLDTDGIDFDGLTGIHGFSIDLNDNTDAGFYAAGSFYWVVVSAVTVDSQTVSFVAATFFLGPAQANVTQYNGTAGTFASGRPEVNLSHIAGSAVSTTTAQLGVNVVQVSGDSTAADNLENAFDDTAGPVRWQFISDQGTLQATTSTTSVTLAATASAEDDVYNGQTIHFPTSTTGAKQSTFVSDYNGTTKVATLSPALAVALSGTTTYKIGATAAGTTPVSANITQISGDSTAADNLEAVLDGTGGVTLVASAFTLTTPITANATQLSGDSTAADNAEAFFDGTGYAGTNNVIPTVTTVTGLTASDVGAIKTKTDQLTFSVANVLNVNTLRINGVTVIGAGTSGDKWRA
jgi:hypothetical protein